MKNFCMAKLLLGLALILNGISVYASSLEDKFNLLNSSMWGINSSSKEVDILMNFVAPPKKSHSGKSYLTVNKMGFDG